MAAANGAQGGLRVRILVVEDDRKIANAVKKGLERESFAVDVAMDGLDGLDLALTEEYDLVILDRMLPNVRDGAEICERLRRSGKDTPVLMLTARAEVADRVEGLNMGADDYLVKPFAFEELLARVRALLRRPKETVGDVLEVEDLALDTGSFRVSRAEVDITLSRTEYALLEYLMRNEGVVLSKEKIIAHVWDFDADVLTNTVEVYIGYLRGKVDKPFDGEALIRTVRGFGYMIGKAR